MMNIEGHGKKTKHQVEIIAGLVLVTFLAWGCISQFHSPLTCQQAKEAWQKKQQDSSKSPQVERLMVSRDTIHPCF